MKTFEARTLERWRAWLAKNHASVSEVWLVFHRRHTGRPTIAYGDALDEALCYGWIDSLIKRLDDDRYARKFTPRKADSSWSSINIRRYNELKASKRLAAPGLERGPQGRPVVDAPPPSRLPDARARAGVEKALKKNGPAWRAFEALASSHRRSYVNWIALARRPETRAKRLREAIVLLRSGKKLGLK